MIRKILVISVSGALLVLTGVVVYKSSAKSEQLLVSMRPAEAERVLTTLIQNSGGESAYETFEGYVADMIPSKQHGFAHAFGAALFAVEDTEGLAVCDEKFSYGCFHEFMGRAILAHGLSVVSELNEGCTKALVKSPLSCQHGIGHGILASLDYKEISLTIALDECSRLPYNDPIGGCYGGAFMEYNMQTMLGTEARLRRPSSEDEIYKPCIDLALPYQSACIFWQPQWWYVAILGGEDSEGSFAQLGAYCRKMTSVGPLRRICFEGIGNITAPSADFDPERARDLCDASSHDRSERLFCRSFAANSLSGGGAGMTGNGRAVCSDLPESEKEFCLAYARNEANILNVREYPL